MWGLVLFMLLLAFFLMAMCADVDITRMQVNGVLDYYPDGYNTWGDIISMDVRHKYPIFSAKIYKEYGIKRLPTDKRED